MILNINKFTLYYNKYLIYRWDLPKLYIVIYKYL